MKLTKNEQECLNGYMENPHYREIVENAPGEACRNYIVHGLVYGFCCSYDPDLCRENLEDGLTAADWRYVKAKLAGNTPFFTKCSAMIRLQEQKEACRTQPQLE